MERKLIGRVGVDSGQLLIIDPCYIDGEWEGEGAISSLDFWGAGENEAAKEMMLFGYKPIRHELFYRIEESEPQILARMTEDLQFIIKNLDKKVVYRFNTNSTYERICELTMKEGRAGQLNYRLGHEGLGVAFQSGFGDGIYDIYATYMETGDTTYSDKRISKVEIILIEED